MFVSRKYLSLIHFVPGKRLAGISITEGLHQNVIILEPMVSAYILLEPSSEGLVKGRMFSTSLFACLVNELFLGTQGNIS